MLTPEWRVRCTREASSSETSCWPSVVMAAVGRETPCERGNSLLQKIIEKWPKWPIFAAVGPIQDVPRAFRGAHVDEHLAGGPGVDGRALNAPNAPTRPADSALFAIFSASGHRLSSPPSRKSPFAKAPSRGHLAGASVESPRPRSLEVVTGPQRGAGGHRTCAIRFGKTFNRGRNIGPGSWRPSLKSPIASGWRAPVRHLPAMSEGDKCGHIATDTEVARLDAPDTNDRAQATQQVAGRAKITWAALAQH